MERQVWNPVTGWWENVEQPRSVAVLATGAHFLTALAGLLVIVLPPPFLAVGLWDGLLTVYWGALLMFGGIVGGFSVIPSAFWAERIAVAALGLALLLHAVAMAELQLRVGWETNIAYQGILNLVLLLHVLIRFERVRHGMRDPGDPEGLNTGPIRTTRRRRR